MSTNKKWNGFSNNFRALNKCQNPVDHSFTKGKNVNYISADFPGWKRVGQDSEMQKNSDKSIIWI